jgi:hypothetical protein
MLNLKKGLAVALAAATALTFAPVSAFAGTSYKDTTVPKDTTTADADSVTMNETANNWTLGTSKVTKDVNNTPSYTEQTPVVVLTPSEQTGSVTFRSTSKMASDVLKDQTWYGASTTPKQYEPKNADKKSEYILSLQAPKGSSTVNVVANVAYLRSLATPETITINIKNADDAADNTINVKDAAATDMVFKVVLMPRAVKMNNLKVIFYDGSDTAYQRYASNSNNAVYSYEEARPTKDGANTKDLEVDQVQLEGTPKTLNADEMNLQDSSKDKTFKVESNADVTYKSNDQSVATIDKDGIHAKGVGSTTVEISTKESTLNYGTLTTIINVNVINKPAAKLAGPDDLYIHGYGTSNAVKIGVTGTGIVKNSISYTFVWWDAASQDWIDYSKTKPTAGRTSEVATLNPYIMDKSSDSVYVESYTGNDQGHYNWGAYLKATAVAADGYTGNPEKYIRLHFDNDAPFELDAASQTLHVGESVQITTKTTRVATGAAFAYKSWNPAVATVSSTGAITAVGEGSTKIDVTYAGRTQSVTVNVKEYENGKNSDGTPVQVTGVTVSNKKGAAVKVTFDKSSIKNVKYYVQKKVSGKTSGKSVGSNKTTLSVKKGATVKVRVKAYYYDAAGNKLVGSYSAWKSLKTDKK